MKEFIIGFIVFGLLVAGAMWFSGSKNKADLSSEYEDRAGQYQQGDGSGHPLWR